MIQAILFDLDGVVIDSEPLYERANRLLFQRYGLSVPPVDWRLFKGLSQPAFFDLVERRYRPRWDRAKAASWSDEVLKKVFREELCYMSGFTRLIERLGGRYELGLVTSTARELMEFIATILEDIGDIFPQILCGDEVERTKPDPEPYRAMMARLGVEPEATAIVEDSIAGLQSAKASGASCIALLSTTPAKDLVMAHRIVGSLDEITEELLSTLQVGELLGEHPPTLS